jgi:hypothetical protein
MLAAVLFGASLVGSVLGTGCAAAGDGDAPASETATGKEDSPYAQEGGPCVTSFDCELGLECVEGGCVPRDEACEGPR